MKIIVDADATPKNALDICRLAAKEFSVPLVTVASFNHRIESDRHVVVGNAPQEADMQVVNLTARGDIVVTQDWGLAAMALGKGAFALSPAGRIFREETIEFLLEEREIKARIRRGGGRTKGPRKRTSEDDDNFKRSLYRLLGKSGRIS
ncbi:YaiI/YqxD family protein [Pelotomaculum propionicicum]|uniref:UPF0178 protein Pmgp_03270 n=1 Tax=Pelotomaculum propionicicum TaxID=258475 RepID=A0A4Y7RKF5_9FIRM|nr:DUF188 domain-containing protein [Pelotomaculum propionicicum]NLI12477.1 DUF188 domain-containing protein [Peptococcaceae bacterium]TEB09281.1 hypothetical protein Pmgp_03270 [Pelotomaculum propionicicum]